MIDMLRTCSRCGARRFCIDVLGKTWRPFCVDCVKRIGLR